MDIEKELKKAGLSKPEIIIYLYLLEQGFSSPPQIAKGTNMQRANTYNVIHSLKEKGLVDKQQKGKRCLYFSKDPSTIVQRLEEKKEAITKILPDLRALYKAEKNKPVIKFHYGMDQVKNIFTRVEGSKEILFILSTDTMFETSPRFTKKYREEIAKKGVFFRDILTYKSGVTISKKTKETMKGYYDFRLLEKKYEDMPTSIRIWNDTVVLISLDEPVFGTEITNKSLASTFRVIFESLWEVGKKY